MGRHTTPRTPTRSARLTGRFYAGRRLEPVDTRRAVGGRRLITQGLISTVVIAVIVAGSQVLTTQGGRSQNPGTSDIAGAAVASYTTGAHNISDTFHRSVRIGLGSAPVGGAYATAGSATSGVSAGAARVSGMKPGTTWTSTLRGMRVQNELVQMVFTVKSLPTRGRGLYLGAELRRQLNGDAYRVRVHVLPGGRGELSLRRLTGDDDASSLRIIAVPFRIQPNQSIVLQGSVSDTTGGASLQARIWKLGSAAPAWQATAVDLSRAALTHAGQVGLCAYLTTSTPSAPFSVYRLDGYQLVPASRPKPGPNPTHASTTAKPVPSKTATPTKTAASTSHSAPSSSHTSKPAPKPTSTKPSSSHSTSSAAYSGGGGVPGPNNTGVPAGTKLTVHNGNLEVKKAGSVISGLDVHGFVIIEAANVTIKNSIIRGGHSSHPMGLIDGSWPAAKNITVQDCELDAAYPASGIDGLKGQTITARRLNIHRTIDGVKVIGSNVSVSDSWIHDLSTMAHDPLQNGGPSHSDGVQIVAGTNVSLRNNRIEGGYNSGLQITQDHGSVRNVTVTGNVLGGGGCTVNVSQKPRSGITGVVITDNRFLHTSKYNCGIIVDRSVGRSITRNYWASGSSLTAASNVPVPVQLRR